MAMETNPASLSNISPVTPAKPVGTDAVERKVGTSAGGSPFQPQTNINLNNSVEDIAALLAKVASAETETENQLPQSLQKMIQTMLQKSFSLEATFSQGIGKAMESQRFTLEQLNTLSRMLTQLGTLAENGSTTTLPDTLQTLLSSLKSLDGNSGRVLDPVSLNKMAFQLLDDTTAADLPVQLQFLLGTVSVPVVAAMPSQQTEGFAFLKQLVQYFMPPASAETTGGEKAMGNTSTAGNTQTGGQVPTGQGDASETAAATPRPAATEQAQTAARADMLTGRAVAEQDALPGQPASAPPAAGRTVPQMAEIPETPVNGQLQEEAQLPGQSSPGSNINAKGQEQMLQSPLMRQGQAANTAQPAASLLPDQAETLPEAAPGSGNLATESRQPSSLPQTAGTTANSGGPTGSSQTGQFSGSLQNTEQMMQTMKSLAGLLLKDASLTENDAALLKNFVNGKQPVLSEQEAKQLQLLIRLSEKNIPASVHQAAQKENMPDLPKLWSFVQLCDLAELKDVQAQQLKQAGKNVGDFAAALRQSMPNENSATENQRSMSFMMPLYMGENERSYPTYVHVYDENKKNSETGEETKETWLRFCLLTENIGAVELVFRLYEQQNLNVRVAFSDEKAVESFRSYIPEFKATFTESPLVLTDLKVSAIGSK